MKRSQDRDGSPRSKRSRSGYPELDHVGSRDRLSPEMDRRGGVRMKPYREFEDMDRPRPKYRDDRLEPEFTSPNPRNERMQEYRSLCVSGASSKIPDRILKDQMYREFEKFGEMNVNVTFSGDQRVAYINFKYPEDARAARHEKSGKLIIFERPVHIEPVYNKIRSSSPSRQTGYDYPPRYPPGNGIPRGPPAPPGYGPPPGRDYMGPPPGPPHPDFPPTDMYDKTSPQQRPFVPHRAPGSEKFPHHLDHVDPEDDEKATRTLFIGNLDYNIAEQELRHIFEAFGVVEEIDIKRPQRGQGNAYAFMKFMNLDYAHRAKVDMSGKYIGRFQCKIGYGKVTPSNCVWVGGLGPWVSHQELEREFDRFGAIHRIEWPHGKNYAYVLYDNIDAAQAAITGMRGFPLGGKEHRIRVDFTDPAHIGAAAAEPPVTSPPKFHHVHQSNFPPKPYYDGPPPPRDEWRGPPPEYKPVDDRRRDEWDRRDDRGNGYRPEYDDPYRRQRSPEPDRRIVRSPGRQYDREYDRENGRRRDDYSPPPRDDYRRNRSASPDRLQVERVESMPELIKYLPVAWNGALILKSSAFPARMHVVSGDVSIVDTLMRDPSSTETPALTIKQRLRLDPSKTDDVKKRVLQAGPRGYCILLALPTTLANFEDPTRSIQQRPLKNLVSYLKQKEAAGVITLPPYPSKDKDNIGLLHSFPPCQFGYDFLLSRAPKLPPDYRDTMDDYIVVVVVRGAA